MAMLQAFQMAGGPHDGERIDSAERKPHPETLFRISFSDGAAYARTGQRVRDEQGQLREVFRFDPNGALTEKARERFAL